MATLQLGVDLVPRLLHEVAQFDKTVVRGDRPQHHGNDKYHQNDGNPHDDLPSQVVKTLAVAFRVVIDPVAIRVDTYTGVAARVENAASRCPRWRVALAFLFGCPTAGVGLVVLAHHVRGDASGDADSRGLGGARGP